MDRGGRLLRLLTRRDEESFAAAEHGRTGGGSGSKYLLPRASVEHCESGSGARVEAWSGWGVRSSAGEWGADAAEPEVSETVRGEDGEQSGVECVRCPACTASLHDGGRDSGQ